MKTNYILGCLLFIFAAAACHKDKGNYSYTHVPDLHVDTVGTQTRFEVFQSQGKVTINPKLVYEGNVNDLTYIWRLYVANNLFDTITTTKNIDNLITRPPATYTLEYEAKDKSGLKALMQYTVVVLPPIPAGIMVAYEDASGNTDVDLMRTSLLVANANDSVYRNIYSNRNGGPLPGKPVAVSYLSTALTHLYTTQTGTSVQNTDFAFVQKFPQLFLLGNSPVVSKPEGYWLGSFNSGMLINDKSVYWVSEGSYVGKVTVDALGYEAAPFVYQQYGKQGGFYDQLNMRFITIEQQTSQAAKFPNASGDARFNLNGIGKKLLSVERGFGQNPDPNAPDPYKYGFFKDVTGSGRYLYIMNMQNPSKPDVAAIDISSAPHIQEAKFFAVGNLGPATFYATPSTVYFFQSSFSSTYSTPEIGFQAPAGEEITCMKLLKSHGTYGVQAVTANDSKFMFLSTWNESSKMGKVYLLSVNITSGAIGAVPLKVWNVSGKVGDMNFKQV